MNVYKMLVQPQKQRHIKYLILLNKELNHTDIGDRYCQTVWFMEKLLGLIAFISLLNQLYISCCVFMCVSVMGPGSANPELPEVAAPHHQQ